MLNQHFDTRLAWLVFSMISDYALLFVARRQSSFRIQQHLRLRPFLASADHMVETKGNVLIAASKSPR
jgi:hypothetical protein